MDNDAKLGPFALRYSREQLRAMPFLEGAVSLFENDCRVGSGEVARVWDRTWVVHDLVIVSLKNSLGDPECSKWLAEVGNECLECP